MTEDFVPFELAKKLQEKGCSVKCLAFYTNVGILHCNESLGPHETYMDLLEMNNNQRGRGIIYDAPTISQVLKWLREEKKIHICIDIYDDGWFFDIASFYKGDTGVYEIEWPYKSSNVTPNYDSFEQAAIAGIEYCLDKLS